MNAKWNVAIVINPVTLLLVMLRYQPVYNLTKGRFVGRSNNYDGGYTANISVLAIAYAF